MGRVLAGMRPLRIGHPVLGLHQLMHDTQPDADAQREQSLPRGADELAERFLNLRW
jgi:hypothetical protein